MNKYYNVCTWGFDEIKNMTQETRALHHPNVHTIMQRTRLFKPLQKPTLEEPPQDDIIYPASTKIYPNTMLPQSQPIPVNITCPAVGAPKEAQGSQHPLLQLSPLSSLLSFPLYSLPSSPGLAGKNVPV